jgi:DNA topoisomerase-3
MNGVLVVAEKPSVARDIAQVLGANARRQGWFEGGGYIVTWAVGHLVALAEPHDMNPAWRRWRLEDLPLLPPAWPLVAYEATRDQYAVVRRLLLEQGVRGVVCATDAGREGELIFRYIYEAAGSKKPVKRLWISSLTPEAIAAGFRSLKDGSAFDRLADAARARSRADWLVGMNLSRAYSVLEDDNLSVGRVQTPTLAMIAAREIEIRDFVPERYLEVVATFGAPGGDVGAPGGGGPYDGTFVASRAAGERPEPKARDARRLAEDGAEAGAIALRAKRGSARIDSIDRQTRRLPPPQLYDLTELQRHANRLFGFTAQRTLQIAQKLYEERKLLSYPRTDSRWLSQAIATTLPDVVRAIEAPYREHLAPGTGSRSLGRRFVDDARVSDHHAIIPTDERAPADLPADERRIYDLVCRRLLSAWHGDHVYAVTTVMTDVACDDLVDRYVSSGASVEVVGWKLLDLKLAPPRAGRDAPPTLPGGLAPGLPRVVVDASAKPKQTRPPPRFTDASLLTAMETAGRAIEDGAGISGLDEKEISQAMRDRGLGTPATRAAIIETLLRREYAVRDGKTFAATEKGIALVARVHPHVKSPAMTGEWEARLGRIERGEESLEGFMGAIERYVREVVGVVASTSPPAPSERARAAAERSPRAPPRIVRVRVVPSVPGGGLSDGGGGQGRPPRHADRRRQVALLPAPRRRARRHHPRREPAHRAHGGSGRAARAARLRRRAHPLRADARRRPRRVPRLPRRRARLPLHRARAPQGPRVPRDARAAKADAHRGRRGSLHLAVGARLPPRLPHARRAPAAPPARAGHRAHRDGHAGRAGRHRARAAPRGARAVHPRLSPDEHRRRGDRA